MTHHTDEPTIADPDSVRQVRDDEPIQLIVPPVLRPALFAWLNSRGLLVGFAADLTTERDLPVYLTSPAHMHKDDPVVGP